jgi:hypothetical protein
MRPACTSNLIISGLYELFLGPEEMAETVGKIMQMGTMGRYFSVIIF